MSPRLWILGGADPEMERIEALLRECGERVEYALAREGGPRVDARGAYELADLPLGTTHVVECAPCGGVPEGVMVIDHHRPGDPGYGRPPEFFSASSIGQVIAELARLGALPEPKGEPWTGGISSSIRDDGWDRGLPEPPRPWERGGLSHAGAPGEWMLMGYRGAWVVALAAEHGCVRPCHIPHDLVLAAASDHCPAAAYLGRCPGVDPDALMRWRVETRAKFQGRDAAAILADVERACAAIETAPQIDLREPYAHTYEHDWSRSVCDGCAVQPLYVRDLRERGEIRELPEASLRLGEAILCIGVPGRDGRRKVNLLGDADGAAVRAYLGGWAESQGLVDLYGDPARGFAGGYLA